MVIGTADFQLGGLDLDSSSQTIPGLIFLGGFVLAVILIFLISISKRPDNDFQ